MKLDPDGEWQRLEQYEELIPCIVTVENGNVYSIWVIFYSDPFATEIRYDRVEQREP